jgi:hypothetical protein
MQDCESIVPHYHPRMYSSLPHPSSSVKGVRSGTTIEFWVF